MGILRINLSPIEFDVLVTAIDGYLQSLSLPDIYPEHRAEYSYVLKQLRLVLSTLSTRKRDIDFVMTELDIVALDEAVQGFIRICERDEKRVFPRTVAMLTRLHEQLAQMKLPPIGQ